MYNIPSKTRRRIRLSLVYTLMIISVISIVTVLVLIIQGYRYNRYDGRIEQGGLAQFASQPSGADVYVDGAQLGNKTPSKLTISSGKHEFTMKRAGYQTWQKSVAILPGSVTWLNYTLLVPQLISNETVASYGAVSSSAATTDGKFMAYTELASTPKIDFVGLDNVTPSVSTINLPVSSYAAPTIANDQSFTVTNWDQTDRYLLVRHDYDKTKNEWLVVDTQGNQTVTNVTVDLGIAIVKAEFTLADNRALYVLTTTNQVRRIDLNASTLSGPLLSNISDFAQYDRATITFETGIDPTTKKRSVGYLTSGTPTPRLLDSYADNNTAPLHLRIGRYYGQNYIVIAYADTVNIMTGDLPSSNNRSASSLKTVVSLAVPGGVTYLGFSPDKQRFLYAQNGSHYLVYDLDSGDLTSRAIKTSIHGPLPWLNTYHLENLYAGNLSIEDFDGTNSRVILTGATHQAAALTPNEDYLYAFVSTGKTVDLVRADLVAN